MILPTPYTQVFMPIAEGLGHPVALTAGYAPRVP